MAKLYVVEFQHKDSDQVFQKLGWTKSYDVMDRFSATTSVSYGNDPAQYANYHIRVLASAYCDNFDTVQRAESDLLKKFPKNIWINESFSGVTEIVSMTLEQRREAIGLVRGYSHKWREERERRALAEQHRDDT